MNNVLNSKVILTLAISSIAIASIGAGPSARAAPTETPITHTVESVQQWGPCPSIFPAGCQIAVLHGDPAKPNADVFLRVPGGYTIPPHTHTSPERIVLVEGQLTVRYQGSAAQVLTMGEYAYGPATLPHEATCAPATSCTLFIAFEGPVDAIAHTGPVQ